MDGQLNYPFYTGGNEIAANDYEVYTFPNPFTADLSVRIFLFKEAEVRVTLYNELGQTVSTICSFASEGSHDFTLNGRDKNGNILVRGIYLYAVNCNGQLIKSGKVIKE
jgi:flagellar hook assembly protein FlgD